MLEWPSQSDTFRRSLVACRMVRAQVCLRTCGETRLDESVGQRVSAVWTCLRRMYSKPARVITSLRALRNSSGTRTTPRTDSQARTADAVSLHSGRQRSFRHFRGPEHWLAVEAPCPPFEGPPTQRLVVHPRNKDGALPGHGCRPRLLGQGHPEPIAFPGQ